MVADVGGNLLGGKFCREQFGWVAWTYEALSTRRLTGGKVSLVKYAGVCTWVKVQGVMAPTHFMYWVVLVSKVPYQNVFVVLSAHAKQKTHTTHS